MKITKILSTLLLAGLMAQAHAAYPDKPIKFVIPYEPGGTTDVLMRALTPSLSKTLGQTVIVENRAGASATIGGGYVARAEPDGYTFLVGASDTATSKYVLKGMQYDPEKNLEMVSRIAWTPYFLIAGKDLQASDITTLKQLNSQKEGGLTYASAGSGTIPHLAGAQFAQLQNLNMLHIPFKGTAPAINELLAGRIDVMFVGLPSSVGHVQAGKLKIIAVAADQRVPIYPDAPTMKEVGGAPFTAGSWFGVLAPKGTPLEIQNKVAAALKIATDDEQVKRTYGKLGAMPIQETPDQARDFYLSDIKQWKTVIEQINLGQGAD